MHSNLVETLRGVCFVIDYFLGMELVDEIRWETWIAYIIIPVFKQREGLIDADGLDESVGHREEVAD